jgi:hypothetical protein
MKEIHIHVSFNRKVISCIAAAAIVTAAVQKLNSESVSMSTYYPAPIGAYTRMVVTQDTVLARDGGVVGIGIANPQSNLSVSGGVQPSLDPAPCTPAKAGARRWNAPTVELCDGVNPWRGGAVAASVGAPRAFSAQGTSSGGWVVHNLGQYVNVSLTSEHFDSCGGSGNCIRHGAYVCAQTPNAFMICNPPLWAGASVRYWFNYW